VEGVGVGRGRRAYAPKKLEEQNEQSKDNNSYEVARNAFQNH